MKKSIRKILKETYDKQLLSSICNRISTGSNNQSPKYIESLISDIMKTDLDDSVKKKVLNVYDRWKKDMDISVDNERYNNVSLNGSTGDSESDIGDMHLSEIQSLVCQIFMDMD